MAHTNTPWKLNYDGDGIESVSGGGITLMTDLFGEPDNTDEGRSNAVHIVRCVNSHDALVAALERIVDRISAFNEQTAYYTEFANARAALKLAKGE